MLDAVKRTLEIYQEYAGGSLLFLFAVTAVIFLWLTEERKEIRIMFVYVVGVITALFFLPVFSYMAMNYFLDDQVYYRLVWLVPMGMIVSYGAVKALNYLEVRRKRVILGILLVLFLVQSGNLIYANPMVTMAENRFKLPDSVIAVANVMHVEDRDVKAVVPGEMLQFIRQYDPGINLAYGREALIEGWGSNPLYDAMETSPVRSYAITDYARAQGVEYIVLRSGTPIVGSKPINKYEFSYLTSVSNYDIYIYDRADFADKKKAEYSGGEDRDNNDYYTMTR